MPSFHLSSITLAPTSASSDRLRVSFRTSSRGGDPLYPATGLQFAFHHGEDEVFAADRLVSRDVAVADDGSCSVLVDGVPMFRHCSPDSAAQTLVRVHAWQGERHLGSWDVGRIQGREFSA